MANQRPQSLQDIFLEQMRSKAVLVTIFLVNGIRLQGYVTYFDMYAIELTRAGQTQVVYKHAISTILPGEPVDLSGAERSSF